LAELLDERAVVCGYVGEDDVEFVAAGVQFAD
jgi:hypothetical protein